MREEVLTYGILLPIAIALVRLNWQLFRAIWERKK